MTISLQCFITLKLGCQTRGLESQHPSGFTEIDSDYLDQVFFFQLEVSMVRKWETMKDLDMALEAWSLTPLL